MQTVNGLCGQVVVRGRGALVGEMRVGVDGVIIRMDNGHDEVWWAEVSLPLWQLKGLVRQVETHRAEGGQS